MDHPSSMQQTPLLISSIIEHAALYHGDREIVSRTIETGAVHRTNYKTILSRSKQLANALISLNVTKGDIIATLAWNSYRHLELYYTISSIGAILHTLNPRLFIEQLVYIINHAQDKFICIDITFLPLLSDLIPHLKTVKGIIILTDENNFKLKDYSNFPKSLSIHCYETLLKNQSSNFTWPIFPDTTPSSLCYTSGTTGNPKGVLYTHRSTVIHSLMSCVPDVLGFSARDNVLVIVPLFHANAWGIPYSATMSGCKMVFAGRDLDGETVLGLMVNEEITFTGAVPSVWVLLFQYIDNMREKKNKLPQVKKLRRVISGGSAVPAALIDRLKREFGAELIQIWGMTEMSPLGTVAGIMARHEGMSWEEELKVRTKQGRAIYGVEMRIVDEDGKELKRDGKDFGHLQVRGPGVVQRYFRESKDSAGEDGWFNTGDIATIDKDGYMQITDRYKFNFFFFFLLIFKFF